jgi:hypothetical protein
MVNFHGNPHKIKSLRQRNYSERLISDQPDAGVGFKQSLPETQEQNLY